MSVEPPGGTNLNLDLSLHSQPPTGGIWKCQNCSEQQQQPFWEVCGNSLQPEGWCLPQLSTRGWLALKVLEFQSVFKSQLVNGYSFGG